MLVRSRDAEPEHDLVDERRVGKRDARVGEVSAGMEDQLLDAGLEGVAFEQRPVGAAVRIGLDRLEQAARPAGGIEIDPYPRAWTAPRGVEHVCGQVSHGLRNLSSMETALPDRTTAQSWKQTGV